MDMVVYSYNVDKGMAFQLARAVAQGYCKYLARPLVTSLKCFRASHLPRSAWDEQRQQWNARKILEHFILQSAMTCNNLYEDVSVGGYAGAEACLNPEHCTKLFRKESSIHCCHPTKQLTLLVVDISCFVPPMTEVFGVAISGEGCLVNIKETLNDVSAMIKVSMHEMGHVLGLDHCCNPACVMAFSEDLFQLNHKQREPCKGCLSKLEYIHPLLSSLIVET
ncbi:hypothetical protein CEUSTIGMA_g7803.t1 [Chlamydomonas eustigma]|uniref:Peptidase M10 metallopeptidase domain-containing protein n=1 Tax=Chlamydomonas eustigma TaxID=1157962 RepID=A0A250XBC9_9CHLO|nr:hypothetical protein CEUSTIGMA_g7803.t1 [Chlamydomonas eustigma]|eukprot:GAX80364.1 hypothetical protein CEUSTIGMA_g7803.t1 [Chlamydomonas eustigma]